MLESIRRRFLSAGPDDVTAGDVASPALAERLGSLRSGRAGSLRAGSLRDGAPSSGPGDAPPALAEFVGYALDCEIRAVASVDGVEQVRWSDLLSAASDIELHETVLIGLSDGVSRIVGDLTVARDELVAVWASTFRGADERRVRTRGERVTFASGPYRVVGYLHALPTVDALGTFDRRATMVPLTEARILVPRPTDAQRTPRVVSGGTLIVNRTLIRDLQLWHESAEYPAVVARFAERMPIKDMTGGSLVA